MSLGVNYLGAWGGAEVGIPGVSAGPAIVPVFLVLLFFNECCGSNTLLVILF